MGEVKHKYGFALIIVVIVFLVTILAVEIYLRAFAGNEMQLNSWGFHDIEHSKLAANEKVVLLIGDSFVEGRGVSISQTVGQRLKAHLNQAVNANVVALGQPGAGQAQELLLLEKYLPIIKPDVVVLAFLPANDILNNSAELEPKKEKPFYRLIDGELSLISKGEKKKPKKFLLKITELIYSQIARKKQIKKLIEAGNGIPLDYKIYETPLQQEWERAWKLTFALLDEIRQRVEKANAEFVLVVIADRWQVHEERFQELKSHYPQMQDLSWSPRNPSERVISWCKEKDVTFIDLYTDFAKESSKNLFLDDGHWNKMGHELSGKVIAKNLLKMFSSEKNE